MQKRKRDIFFHIETEAQFDSVKPLLVHLRDNTKINFDIVVPSASSEQTIVNEEVYEGGARALLKSGFSITRSVDGVVLPNDILDTKYKVLLSAYMYDSHYQNVNAKYRIMFPYASYYFNKPYWTVKQFINQDYLADALLSHAVGTKPVTDIFTKTYLVPSLKLMSFQKKSTQSKKPVLFFAPTYEEIDFAASFLNSIEEIKKKYTVIMRGHHRVSHVKNNKDISEKLYRNADKIYDVTEYSIVKPLEEADVVVSDNSAVIFDAIYCGVPVALFSQNPNSFHYMGINTSQSELVKNNDILWTSDPQQIHNVIDETLTAKMLKKQVKMHDRLFPEKPTDPVGQWMKVLSVYLGDDLPYEYSLAKQYWIENIQSQQENNQKMHAEIENLNLRLQHSDARLSNEQNPGVKTALKRFVKACLHKLRLTKRSA